MRARTCAPLVLAIAAALAAVATPAGASGAAPHVVGAGRALSGQLAATGGRTASSVRVTSDPVTGRTCARVDPPSLDGLALQVRATTTGAAVSMADTAVAAPGWPSYAACGSLAPTVAADLLAHPEAYALVEPHADGSERAGPLAPDLPRTRASSVGTRTETVVDGSRGTARRGAVGPTGSRVLRITYWFPTDGPAAPTAGDVVGADPSLEGPFPVVLFAHGFASTPQDYAATLRAWAAAGYVVAAPLFPGSGSGLPGSPTEADLTQQPRDLRLVLDLVTRHSRDAGSWLGGIADGGRVAVAGHSDGGSTAAAAGLLAGYTDRRYAATIVMAGARFAGAPARRTPPLLLLSGERDEYNEPATFARVYATARGPRTWVQAVGGGHAGPFVAGDAQAVALRELEVAFLDRWLLGTGTARAERTAASLPGLTRVRAGGF